MNTKSFSTGVMALFLFLLPISLAAGGEITAVTKVDDHVIFAWGPFGTGSYTVEHTQDLVSSPWEVPEGTWPISGTIWIDQNVLSSQLMRRFYRVESGGLYTNPVAFVRILLAKRGFTMISAPLVAADNRLNGNPGCIGDIIKENLTGGLQASLADTLWKWDTESQSFKSAFLVAGRGEAYDGRWWDEAADDFSTLTLDPGEGFWILTRPPAPTAWSRTFGGNDDDRAYSVQQTSDGGYIVAGLTSSFGAGSSDVYLIKTDAEGNELWSRTFGGPREDWAYSVQETSDGGYIVAGGTSSFGAGWADAYLIKTDAEGNEVWTRTFGGPRGDWGESVQQTSDGGYIVAGTTTSFGAGGDDFYLIKTDAEGKEQWSKTFGGSDMDWGYSVQETSDGGYIVAGTTNSFRADFPEVYLIKTDPSGAKLWQKSFGAEWGGSASSVRQTSDGGYIVGGHRYAGETNDSGPPFDQVYLIRTDPSGAKLWDRTFGGRNEDYAFCVRQTSDGGYVLVGHTNSFGAGWFDVYLIKTDQNGSEEWSKTFGGTYQDTGFSVEQTSDGGYIVAGRTDSFGTGSPDVYLIKTDAQGNAPPPE